MKQAINENEKIFPPGSTKFEIGERTNSWSVIELLHARVQFWLEVTHADHSYACRSRSDTDHQYQGGNV